MLLPLILLLAAASVGAATAPLPPPLASDPLPEDWRPIADDDLMLVTLAGGRVVVVRLAPGFAPAHVANIRSLARARWWDATSVYRVQDNWVAQWGDATEHKPLPAGVAPRPAAEFEGIAFAPAQLLAAGDGYAGAAGITADGWAVASGAGAGTAPLAGDDGGIAVGPGATAGALPNPVEATGRRGWLVHCYASVGVARDALPDTGSGAELFTPIGQSARRLDRNYTVVGRIIDGMPYLSALPRSAAPMGMYATAAERTPIMSVRLASDLPAADRPHYQYRAADNVRFAALVAAKLHPAAPMVAPRGIDVCDVPLATRRVEQGRARVR